MHPLIFILIDSTFFFVKQLKTTLCEELFDEFDFRATARFNGRGSNFVTIKNFVVWQSCCSVL